MPELKLEIGKTYMNRIGGAVLITRGNGSISYPYGSTSDIYCSNGAFFSDVDYDDDTDYRDLVQEVNIPLPTGSVTHALMEDNIDDLNVPNPNTQAYLDFHAEVCERMKAITKAKNADYTGEGDDPFANFKIVELNGITSTERGFLVRMSDKMARITSFVQKGTLEVKDESVQDTLMDLANYAILMMGFLNSEKDK